MKLTHIKRFKNPDTVYYIIFTLLIGRSLKINNIFRYVLYINNMQRQQRANEFCFFPLDSSQYTSNPFFQRYFIYT